MWTMAVESCHSSRLTELFGDRLLYGSTTVELNESTFNDSLIALYFVPLSNETVLTDHQALIDLYKTANENKRTLSIIQICYPNTFDDRRNFDELTNCVPWHSVLYECVEKRVRQNPSIKLLVLFPRLNALKNIHYIQNIVSVL